MSDYSREEIDKIKQAKQEWEEGALQGHLSQFPEKREREVLVAGVPGGAPESRRLIHHQP